MNNSKRYLIISVIVLNILSIALNIWFGVRFLMAQPYDNINVFYAVYYFLGGAAYLVADGLLFYSIKNKGQFFRARHTYYFAAVIIVVFLNTISLSSILLIVTLFMTDMVWVKPHDDVYFSQEENVVEVEPEEKSRSTELSAKERDKKIAELRRLKDEGIITEDEFNAQLFKLL